MKGSQEISIANKTISTMYLYDSELFLSSNFKKTIYTMFFLQSLQRIRVAREIRPNLSFIARIRTLTADDRWMASYAQRALHPRRLIIFIIFSISRLRALQVYMYRHLSIVELNACSVMVPFFNRTLFSTLASKCC